MPPLDKSRVLGMLFRGYSAREVAKKFGVSNVTVSKTLRDFVSEAEGANSVLAAAEKHGIEEQVRQLIAIGGVVEETKVDASRAGLGLRIVKAVEGFGVDPDGVPGFIEAVNKEASDQHLSAETFVKVVKGIHGMKVDGMSDYVAFEKSVEAKHGEFERLDDQVYEYEGKAEAAKAQMDEAVNKKNTTLEELDDYVALRDRLTPHGLDLRDVDKAEKCLLNIKEQGSDPVAVVAVYSRDAELSKKVKDMELRVGYLSKSELIAGNKLNETNKELESKTELAERVREAEALGLRPSQLGLFVEKAREVGARHGLGMKESISRLEADLRENWEPKLGFENNKTKLVAELDQWDERVELAEERERVILEKVRAREGSFKELEELRKHVSASELVEFRRVIVDSGQNVPSFRGEVERLGSVTAAVDAARLRKEADVAKLETRVKTLGAQVEQLNNTKTQLEAKILTLNSNAIEAITKASNTMEDMAKGLKEDFENPETGFRATMQTIKTYATAEMNQSIAVQRESFEQSISKFKKFIERSTAEVKQLRNSSWNTGELIGYNVHLLTLAKIVAGEPVERMQTLVTMQMTVNAFADYLAKLDLAKYCPSCMKFIDELRGQMA
ncbi:MAG: hypothetical protein ABSA11_05500 [Candidatus Bathyarchaeia archaeon]|jgi:hypothetical protein